MPTPALPPYSLSEALSFLETLRHYILFGEPDTPYILAGVERLQVCSGRVVEDYRSAGKQGHAYGG